MRKTNLLLLAWERVRRPLALSLLLFLGDRWPFSWWRWVVHVAPSASLRCWWEPSSCFFWPPRGWSLLLFRPTLPCPPWSVRAILSCHRAEGAWGRVRTSAHLLHRCRSPALYLEYWWYSCAGNSRGAVCLLETWELRFLNKWGP